MSKWGTEEKETLDIIKQIDFKGKILNIAAGDGRFNSQLLEIAESVMAIDISEVELKALKENCPVNLQNKLMIETIDITKEFPFKNDKFDGVFCTGTLHLFDKEVLAKILDEIKRVLKSNGKIIIDFATDITRLDKNGGLVIFEGEGQYKSEESITYFNEILKDFDLTIDVFDFTEENLEEDAGYKSINGKFLLIYGTKL